jgi:uncharacterized membrane protein
MNRLEDLFDHRAIDTLARIGLGAGLVAMGILTILTGHVSLQGGQTWLESTPLVPIIVMLTAALLLAFGAMLLLPAATARGATYAAIMVLVWVAVISLPTSLSHAANIAGWLGPTELFVIAMGLRVLGLQGRGHGTTWLRWRDRARIALAVCFIVFGVSHFAYLEFTAGMIPAFLPFHTPLAALTGALHIAIGLGLLMGKTARLAIGFAALMMSSFVLLVHVPAVISTHGDLSQLIMLAKALLLASAAWMLSQRWNRDVEAQQ